MSWPFIITFPDLIDPFWGKDLNKARASVLLPDPDSPTIPIDCSSSISKETSSTAARFPALVLYSIVKFLTIVFSLLLFVCFPDPNRFGYYKIF